MPLPIITGDMESVKNLAICGAGIAILPRCCAALELKVGLLQEIVLSEQLPSIEYFLIQRKNDRLDRIASLFLQKAMALIQPTPA
jgi:DNA-binding transcriptional LysR family regulator